MRLNPSNYISSDHVVPFSVGKHKVICILIFNFILVRLHQVAVNSFGCNRICCAIFSA